MKMGQVHIVPLSRQAVAVLEKLRPLPSNREHVFPNEHKPQNCMSENTIMFALYRMAWDTGAAPPGTASGRQHPPC
jgi:integrase